MPDSKGNILVVDDDPTSLHLIADILEPKGFQLTFGTRGSDAHKYADKNTDLILLDYHLPDANGIEVCKFLKNDPNTASIPVIFITSNQDNDLEAEGLDAGAVDFITKPYSVAVMLARVTTHVALKRQTDLLTRLARFDDLTGVFNRRHVFEIGERDFSRSKRLASPMCAMLIDIDFFKKINDTYGHDVGDIALKVFAKTIKQRVRAHDVFGRIGGEEFVVLLPDTTPKDAENLAYKLLQLIRNQSVEIDGGRIVKFTVSIGIGILDANMRSLDGLIKQADEKLYRAKKEGRDMAII
jgi:diguanylate cyclase (GGDEF)-like protein